jgi:hypothetical protein
MRRAMAGGKTASLSPALHPKEGRRWKPTAIRL